MKFKSQLMVFALGLAASQFLVAQDTNFTLTLSGYTGTDGYGTLPDLSQTAIGNDTPFDIQIGFNTSSPAGSLGSGSVFYVPTSEQIWVGGTVDTLYTATVTPGSSAPTVTGDLVGFADPSWSFFSITDIEGAGFVQNGGGNGFLPFYPPTTAPGWTVAPLTPATFPAAVQTGDLQATEQLSFAIASDTNPLNVDYDSSYGLTATLNVPEGGAGFMYLLLAGGVCCGAIFFKRRAVLTA